MDRIRELTKACIRNTGASPGELSHLCKTLGVILPADYLEMLSNANGIEGDIGPNYVSIWRASEVAQFGRYEFAPNLLFFASNGGGEGFAYDIANPSRPIINVPFIGMSEDVARVLGYSMAEFLERLASRPLFDTDE